MFSALSKVAGLILGGDGGVSEDDGNHGIDVVPTSDVSKSEYKTEVRRFQGKITSLLNGNGMIDNAVYFSSSSVAVKNSDLRVGCTVFAVAERRNSDAGWKAKEVITISPEKLTHYQEDEFEWDMSNSASVCDDKTKYSTISVVDDKMQKEDLGTIAMVTNITADGGSLSTGHNFMLSDVKKDYKPYRGDWVIGTENSSTTGSLLQLYNVKPLREKTFTGHINSVQGGFGFINEDIYFRFDVCQHGYSPRWNDFVHGVAIETSTGRNIWRAISVSPIEKTSDTLKKVLNSPAARIPVSSRWTAELCSDKEGVVLTGLFDIGQMNSGEKLSTKLQIKNEGGKAHILKSCKILGQGDSQFTINQPKLTRASQIKLADKACVLECADWIKLDPGFKADIEVFCNGRHLGRDMQLLVLEFSNFKIGRQLSVTVCDPMQKKLEPYNDRFGPKRNRLPFQAPSDNTWLVPGQRPQLGKTLKHLPNRLPLFAVPTDVRLCVLEKGDVLSVLPILQKDLSPEIYADRFSALLHLEEIQQEIDMRNYGLERVCLRRFGEFLALSVPGLAEGRPSLLTGDKVVLSAPGLEDESPEYEGFVHDVMKDEVLLKFHQDFHSSYKGEDYNVEFSLKRTIFRRCHQAVRCGAALGEIVLFPVQVIPKIAQNKVTKSTTPRKAYLSKPSTIGGVKKCPLGRRTQQPADNITFFDKRLNKRQKTAVLRILDGQSRPTPYVIFGPPGTGKTITVVEAVLQIFTNIPHSRIVACAPSNNAADLLCERLLTSNRSLQKSDIVRLNAFWRQEESVPECIQEFCSDGDQLEMVARHRLLICTCTMAGMLYSLGLKAGHFTHVFVDEAGQATEAECMIPIGLIGGTDGQIVLAGDPMQLGPVLRSKYSIHYGLQYSYLERLMCRQPYLRDEVKFVDHGSYDPLLVTKLVENYRSHPVLLDLPSQLFYHGELEVSANKDLVSRFCEWEMLPNIKNCPLLFCGVRGEDMREGDSPSWFNPVEVVQVIKYLKDLATCGLCPNFDDIGIITPYRKQVHKIRKLIDALSMTKVKVGSVEEFQGQEKQIIILSTVRSNASFLSLDLKYNLGFLSNPKRFNVSITRAHGLLIVVGNPHVLAQDTYWRALLEYSIRHNAYVGCDLPLDLQHHIDLLKIEQMNAAETKNETNTDSSTSSDNESEDSNSVRMMEPEVTLSDSSVGEEEENREEEQNKEEEHNQNVDNVHDVMEAVHVCSVKDVHPDGSEAITSSVNNVAGPTQHTVTSSRGDEKADTQESCPDEVDNFVECDIIEPSQSNNAYENSSLLQVSLSEPSGTENESNSTVSSLYSTDYDKPTAICPQEVHKDKSSLDDKVVLVPSSTPLTQQNAQCFQKDKNVRQTALCETDNVKSSEVSNLIDNAVKITSYKKIENQVSDSDSFSSESSDSSDDEWETTDDDAAENKTIPEQLSIQGVDISDREKAASTTGKQINLKKLLATASANVESNLKSKAEITIGGLTYKTGKQSTNSNPEESVDCKAGFDLLMYDEENLSKKSSGCADNKTRMEDVLRDFKPFARFDEPSSVHECKSETSTAHDRFYVAKGRRGRSQMDDPNRPYHSKSDSNIPQNENSNRNNNKSHNASPGFSQSDRNTSPVWSSDKTSSQNLNKDSSMGSGSPHNPSYNMRNTEDIPPRFRRNERQESNARHPPTADAKLRNRTPVSVEKKIIRQVEYYFSDFNLMKDKFLQQEILKDDENWVSLSMIASFNRMKSLSTDLSFIAAVLKQSTSGLLEVDTEAHKIRSLHGRPWLADKNLWIADMNKRAIVAEGIPGSHSIDDLSDFFSLAGNVEHVERKICKAVKGAPHQFVDLIIFFKESGVSEMMRRKQEMFYNDIEPTYHFKNSVVSQAVDYLYENHILGYTRYKLRPIGRRQSRQSGGKYGHQDKPAQNRQDSNSESAISQRQIGAEKVPQLKGSYDSKFVSDTNKDVGVGSKHTSRALAQQDRNVSTSTVSSDHTNVLRTPSTALKDNNDITEQSCSSAQLNKRTSDLDMTKNETFCAENNVPLQSSGRGVGILNKSTVSLGRGVLNPMSIMTGVASPRPHSRGRGISSIDLSHIRDNSAPVNRCSALNTPMRRVSSPQFSDSVGDCIKPICSSPEGMQSDVPINMSAKRPSSTTSPKDKQTEQQRQRLSPRMAANLTPTKEFISHTVRSPEFTNQMELSEAVARQQGQVLCNERVVYKEHEDRMDYNIDDNSWGVHQAESTLLSPIYSPPVNPHLSHDDSYYRDSLEQMEGDVIIESSSEDTDE